MARFAAAVLCTGAVLLAPSPTRAHSFYDQSCCANKDCHPTPCERITSVAGGFEYRDYAGTVYFFTRDKMKPSQDGECHICIARGVHAPTASPTCVYLPVRM